MPFVREKAGGGLFMRFSLFAWTCCGGLTVGVLKEFRDFAMRGNVIDMAVGIIIGGAFGKIVSSFVNDVLMPPLGILIGQVDFKQFAWHLKPETVNEKGVHLPAVDLRDGQFINNIVDFVMWPLPSS